MKKQVDPKIDEALISACRTLALRHKASSEAIVTNDALLDQLMPMVAPVCDWSRNQVRRRVTNLRKQRKMPTLKELIGAAE